MPSVDPQTAHTKKSSFWQPGTLIKNNDTLESTPKKDKKRRPLSLIDTLTLKRKSTNSTLSLPASPATPTDIIKLSTVNKCGIYMPPSPSDDDVQIEHYFDSPLSPSDNFCIPNNKIISTTERGCLFTPSTQI